VVCGIAGGLIGGSIGYATSGSSEEEPVLALGCAGAAIGALLCADRSPEPEPSPSRCPSRSPPRPVPEFEPVTLESDVTFAFDSAELRPGAASELNQVANTLVRIPRFA
jgi:OmpA-OmpF porin, OOP family